jgi:hypothetical protein
MIFKCEEVKELKGSVVGYVLKMKGNSSTIRKEEHIVIDTARALISSIRIDFIYNLNDNFDALNDFLRFR